MENIKYILVVEDENTLAFALKKKLESVGYMVDVAMDGKEALVKVGQKKPDLILLDLILPVMDGFAVLKELKKSPDSDAIPVIVLTNLSSDEDIADVLNAGGTDYFIKTEHSLDDILMAVKSKLETTV
jgi:DNA-binding response OmpR family regulator